MMINDDKWAKWKTIRWNFWPGWISGKNYPEKCWLFFSWGLWLQAMWWWGISLPEESSNLSTSLAGDSLGCISAIEIWWLLYVAGDFAGDWKMMENVCRSLSIYIRPFLGWGRWSLKPGVKMMSRLRPWFFMLSGFVLFSAYLNKPKTDSMFGLLGAKKYTAIAWWFKLANTPLSSLVLVLCTRPMAGFQPRYVLRRSGTIYPLYAFALFLEPCLSMYQSIWQMSNISFCEALFQDFSNSVCKIFWVSFFPSSEIWRPNLSTSEKSGLSPGQSEREHLHGVAHAAGTKLFDASLGAIFHRERFADALLVLEYLSLT